jgi:hypothetical protein
MGVPGDCCLILRNAILSDRRTLLLASALDGCESAVVLGNLRSLNFPNATRYLATHGKVETQSVAKIFNVERGYPARLAALQTISAWAELPYQTDMRFRDGFDLYCLSTMAAAEEGFDYAILVRDPTGLQLDWTKLQTSIEGRLVRVLEPGPNVLFNFRDHRMTRFFDCLGELYESGVAYAIEPYCISDALSAAENALRIEDRFGPRMV